MPKHIFFYIQITRSVFVFKTNGKSGKLPLAREASTIQHSYSVFIIQNIDAIFLYQNHHITPNNHLIMSLFDQTPYPRAHYLFKKLVCLIQVLLTLYSFLCFCF